MKLSDIELDVVVGGSSSLHSSNSDLKMIELQSLVSNRATQLQLVTDMMGTLNDSNKAVASNIGK